jgi:hypothetical protein
MHVKSALAFVALALGCAVAVAQEPAAPELKIDSTNRTLTVSASDSVSVEPEVAVLHIGFDTQPEDAKSAYADGARASNAIIEAIKQAGIPEDAIHSESQYLDRDWSKPHKFKLSQQWTVKVPPARAAEILDLAVAAGATTSGQIDWTVKDEKALEAEALDRAASRARQNAAVLAKGMGVGLGSLIYVSNQVSSVVPQPARFQINTLVEKELSPQPLAIEPREVNRTATVYAVFAIE